MKVCFNSNKRFTLGNNQMATNREIVHAYRHLYRNLLKAVQHTAPQRFTARDQLRAAFREPGAAFDRQGIRRTVWFLEGAAREKGMEHKILKNLLDVRRRRDRGDPFGIVLHKLRNS